MRSECKAECPKCGYKFIQVSEGWGIELDGSNRKEVEEWYSEINKLKEEGRMCSRHNLKIINNTCRYCEEEKGMNEMTNLKTLKDITIPEMSMTKGYKIVTNHKWVNKDMMQDIAKEWIKELEKGEKDYPLDELPDDIIACNATTYGEIIGYDAKSWIRYFFNLDDE